MKSITKFFVFALIVMGLTGCTGCSNMGDSGKAQIAELKATEANQQRLQEAVPAPELKDSLERTQLKRRLERFNQSQKISYIYLMSYGRVMAYYSIKGKVSSVNSMLTCTEQPLMVRTPGGDRQTVVVPSPDLDGSYGSNGDAIFFFTTDDTYVEWNSEYLLSDRPLRLQERPLLIQEIKE